jgi:hypothetical protein
MQEDGFVSTESNSGERDINAWLFAVDWRCEEGELLMGDAMLAIEEGTVRRLELGVQTLAELWRNRNRYSPEDFVSCAFPSDASVQAVGECMDHLQACTRCRRGGDTGNFVNPDLKALLYRQRLSN